MPLKLGRLPPSLKDDGFFFLGGVYLKLGKGFVNIKYYGKFLAAVLLFVLIIIIYRI